MMLYYLIIINITTFFIYCLDKFLAIKKKRRVSEYHLLTLSIFGGCFLGIISMFLVHHKTRKRKFIIINLLSIIIWLCLIIK